MRYISFHYSSLDRFRQALLVSYMVSVGLPDSRHASTLMGYVANTDCHAARPIQKFGRVVTHCRSSIFKRRQGLKDPRNWPIYVLQRPGAHTPSLR